MEDEYHFLNVCSAYQEKRNVILFDNLTNEHLIRVNEMCHQMKYLLNPAYEKPETQKLITKHVFECLSVCKYHYL